MSSPHGIPGLKLRRLESDIQWLSASELAAVMQVARVRAAAPERPDDLWRRV
jgi:hypothetical protein